jgi:MoaA/NifB/PqqE/SkfB family radical SAM enzyme
MESINPLIFKGIQTDRTAFSGPKTIQIDITGKCNNNCIGCWVHSPYIKDPPRDKNKEIPFKIIERLINELAAIGTQEVFLAGSGEPLLHPQIMQIISLIKKSGLKLNIITNTLLLTEKISKLLVDSQVEMITASIWAGNDQSYVRTHPGKKSKDFYTIRDNLCFLDRLKSERKVFLPKVKIYNVICNLNYEDIERMIDFSLDVGAQEVEFQLVDTIEGQTSFLALSVNQINKIKDQLISLQKRPDVFFKDLVLSSRGKKEKELIEFPGRFCRGPQGFLLNESMEVGSDETEYIIRSLTCKNNSNTSCSVGNPLINEFTNTMIFSFNQEDCQNCSFFGSSCLVDSERKVLFKYLKISGYGSFMHKLTSPGLDEQNYEKGVIDNYPCYIGWLYSRVLSTGEVIPCCKGVNKVLGNIYQRKFLSRNKFYSIWNSSLYREFRFKAKKISKDQDYFKDINCFKSCDHFSTNVKLETVLKNRNYEINKTKVKKLKGNLKKKNIIKVPANSFFRGNLNNSDYYFGKGIVIDGGKGFAFAEYKVLVPKTKYYEVWAYYANNQERPVDLYIDGILLAKNIIFCSSGGWDSKSLGWMNLLTVEISQGEHIFKIYADGFIPHLHTFFFVERGQFNSRLFNNVLSLEKYVKPMLLGNLFSKIMSLGLKKALVKAFQHLYLQKPLSDYLDILGIFDGRKAFKGPFHVQIDLTDHCNNNCLACWCNSPLLEEKKHSEEQKCTLPFELAKELFDNLSDMGTREIYFSGGGEPFCHPRIMDILAYAKKKGFICYVNTNFTLLDKDKIDQLVGIGVDHLTVSIWAATAEVYVKTHPNKTKETFLQLSNNLKYLNSIKKDKPYIKLYNVIFNENYRELLNMVDFARWTGCESLEYTFVDTIPGKTEKLLLNPEQIKELQQDINKLSSMIDRSGKIGDIALFRFDTFKRRASSCADLTQATYDRNIIDKMPCYIGWCFARILPNGDINSCLKSHRIPVGNLYFDNFVQIWNNDKQVFFRNKTLAYKKNDVFFRSIGNDPHIKEAGCYKSCDDIGRNAYVHNRIKSLTIIERLILKLIARLKLLPYCKEKINYSKGDLLLAGIKSGRKAFIGPEQVVVDLTNHCNQRCIGCWLYSPLLKEKPNEEITNRQLSLESAKDLILSLAELGTKRIRFTGGGEPFMHSDIMNLIECAKSKGLVCCITTNFALLNKQKIKDLIRLEVDELAISLWASNSDTYQKIHPGSPYGSFEKIKENLIFLSEERKDKPRVTLCNVICNLNYLELEEMFKFALEMKVDGVYFTLLDALEGTQSLLLNAEQRQIVLMSAEAIKNSWRVLNQGHKIELEYFEGFISRLKEDASSCGNYDYEMVNKIPCYAGWSFARVLADGSIAPCCRGVNKIMGNINSVDFKDIWFSPLYREFRSKAKYLMKTDPYFMEIGCLKMCDNLMHNEAIHKCIAR